jgi:hypothetical protein
VPLCYPPLFTFCFLLTDAADSPLSNPTNPHDDAEGSQAREARRVLSFASPPPTWLTDKFDRAGHPEPVPQVCVAD